MSVRVVAKGVGWKVDAGDAGVTLVVSSMVLQFSEKEASKLCEALGIAVVYARKLKEADEQLKRNPSGVGQGKALANMQRFSLVPPPVPFNLIGTFLGRVGKGLYKWQAGAWDPGSKEFVAWSLHKSEEAAREKARLYAQWTFLTWLEVCPESEEADDDYRAGYRKSDEEVVWVYPGPSKDPGFISSDYVKLAAYVEKLRKEAEEEPKVVHVMGAKYHNSQLARGEYLCREMAVPEPPVADVIYHPKTVKVPSGGYRCPECGYTESRTEEVEE